MRAVKGMCLCLPSCITAVVGNGSCIINAKVRLVNSSKKCGVLQCPNTCTAHDNGRPQDVLLGLCKCETSISLECVWSVRLTYMWAGVMTTSSSWHGGEGDLSITVEPAQLLTMVEIPGRKTTKDMQIAQVSLQVCVCIFRCDKNFPLLLSNPSKSLWVRRTVYTVQKAKIKIISCTNITWWINRLVTLSCLNNKYYWNNTWGVMKMRRLHHAQALQFNSTNATDQGDQKLHSL